MGITKQASGKARHDPVEILDSLKLLPEDILSIGAPSVDSLRVGSGQSVIKLMQG